MSIEPQGEELRRAIKWISEQQAEKTQMNPIRLIECACLKFDLSPKDEDFLMRVVKKDRLKEKQAKG